MNWQAWRGAPVVQLNRREIFRQQEIADLQFIGKRARKAGADQKIELLILEKFTEPFATNLFSDAGMQDFNLAISDDAADCTDAISVTARFIPEPAQKFRALRRQSKRDSCSCHIERKRLPSRSFMRRLETSLIILSLDFQERTEILLPRLRDQNDTVA